MPEDSFPFNTYSGLLTPKHYKRIGSAIWLFLWCISSTTAEKEKDGVVWGIVLGNKPQKLPELAERFGVNQKTVSRWLETLENEEYIKITRAPYGLIFTVKNSKKFKVRKDKNVQSDPKRDKTKMSTLSTDKTEMSNPVRSDKNVQSKKDITELDITNINNNAADIYAHEESTGGVPTTESVQLADTDQSKGQIPGSSLSDFEQLKEKYMRLAGIGGFDVSAKDRHSIELLLEYKIDVNKLLDWLEECFSDYKPKHKFDKINSFAYCIPIILDKHVAEEDAKKGKPQVRKGRGYSRKPLRQELVPEWMEKKDDPENNQPEQDVVSFEEKKRLFEERLKQQKNG
ncbi:hypothetical protein V7112_08700 [Bacillus sp. JJ1566]|uniref:hypothetical protein n=1 Tax=Bacillus sp. JJ1566 TaxID=3122961 RepID=UPI002FFD5A9B